MTTAPDAAFCDEIEATGHKVLWDPGEGKFGGYALYGVTEVDAEVLRAIAKKYGMRAQFYKDNQAMWINRKGAKFDGK